MKIGAKTLSTRTVMSYRSACRSALVIVIALAALVSAAKDSNDQPEKREIRIIVDTVFPEDNPSETYKYYSLPFCQPKQVYEETQTLGEELSGDRKMNSVYSAQFQANISPGTIACTKNITESDIEIFRLAIDEFYVAEFYVEDIPTHDIIGESDLRGPKLKNNINFNIYVIKDTSAIRHANISAPESTDFIYLDEIGDTITFYYSVQFHTIDADEKIIYVDQITSVEPKLEGGEVHWFSIITSFVLVFFLGLFLVLLIRRSVTRDFSAVLDIEDDRGDEVGWKQIRTEALMPPDNRLLLSGFIGTGLSLLVTIFVVTVLGILGLFYGHKGNIKTAALVVYALSGLYNGYNATKYYKFMGGRLWALNLFVSAVLFPALILIVWSIVNSIAWGNDSTAAVPFRAAFFVVVLIVLVQLPLTIVGGLIAKIRCDETLPNVDSSLPRLQKPILQKSFVQSSFVNLLIAGGIPFVSIYIELYYVVSSVWGHRIYHLYGILLIASVLLVLVVIIISVTLTYMQLNVQDYNWQWRSFVHGGCVSVFVWIYSFYYYFNKSTMHGVIQSSFYFGYMTLFCIGGFFMFGSIAFVSSLKFVRYIYNQSKIE